MLQEYWKWPEDSWVSNTMDWRNAGPITAGVDVGTTSTQAAILCGGALFGYANIRTKTDFKSGAAAALSMAMAGSGMTAADIAIRESPQ